MKGKFNQLEFKEALKKLTLEELEEIIKEIRETKKILEMKLNMGDNNE